eukprot:2500425-Lingulodinium_polyedra.AAC.1
MRPPPLPKGAVHALRDLEEVRGSTATVRARRDAMALGATGLEEGDQHVVAGPELRRRAREDQA